MFGRGKDEKGDSGIAKIETGLLNLFYVDQMSGKREKSNKTTGEDITVAILSDANESEFRKLVDEYVTEKGGYDRKFPFYVISNGYYCVDLKVGIMFPNQW